MTTLCAGYWQCPYDRFVMLNPSGAFRVPIPGHRCQGGLGGGWLPGKNFRLRN